MAFSFHLPGL